MLGLLSGLLGVGSVVAMLLANSGNLAGTHEPGAVTGLISAGGSHTCAIKTNGTLARWAMIGTGNNWTTRPAAPSLCECRFVPHLRRNHQRTLDLLGK
jgi:hypothetical protein